MLRICGVHDLLDSLAMKVFDPYCIIIKYALEYSDSYSWFFCFFPTSDSVATSAGFSLHQFMLRLFALHDHSFWT